MKGEKKCVNKMSFRDIQEHQFVMQDKEKEQFHYNAIKL